LREIFAALIADKTATLRRADAVTSVGARPALGTGH